MKALSGDESSPINVCIVEFAILRRLVKVALQRKSSPQNYEFRVFVGVWQ